MILVTGGAGFIGSNFVKLLASKTSEEILVLDNFTYASKLGAKEIIKLPIIIIRADILNLDKIENIFTSNKITTIFHFAAESHVDNSISNCQPFIDTNITGTVNLLNLAVKYNVNKFIHISTDEVFGVADNAPFNEKSYINPLNPYSASKAAAEHFVNAFANTYRLNTIIVNCSNNYGPNQYPEKLIPVAINKLLSNQKIPLYGKGEQVRDWLYVEDCCRAIYSVYEKGQIGQRYCIGGENTMTNMQLVSKIIEIMGMPDYYFEYVKDRPGHDMIYDTDITKIKQELGWYPTTSIEEGLKITIDRIKNEDRV